MQKQVVTGGVVGSVLSSLGGSVVLLGATAATSVLWPLIGGFAIGAGVTYMGTKVVEAFQLTQAMELLNRVTTTSETVGNTITQERANEADNTEE